MDEIGLLDSVLETSGKFENIFLKTKKGDILSKSRPKSDYPVVCMHRADLHSVLLSGIKVELHTNKCLRYLTHLENEQIEIIFNDESRAVFDVVVGADGIHSVVRKRLLMKV